MPRGARPDLSPAATALARWRLERGLTQAQLADAVGISVPTLQRYENARVADPSLKVLVNCSIALRVGLEDVCEPAWLEWNTLVASRPNPPA